MAREKLIELKPGKGLDSGVFPSAQPTVGAVWRTAINAWFRELHIEHMPGSTRIVPVLGRASKAMAQAYVNGPRLYYEDLGVINYVSTGVSTVIGTLDSNGIYDLTPYGTWLIATDNVNPLKIWKGTGTFQTAGDVESQFSKCKILTKLGQHVLAYGSDVFPAGFHWCSASNPELWTPAANNSAGNLPIRDLDSDIIAVAHLGAAHAVYSQDHMLVVQYTGAGQWFGTPNQALSGIGAVSSKSVVSLGKVNWGLCKGGVFYTDGNGFAYVDRPAIDRWLQENVDWARADDISCYFNDQLMLVIWSIPTLDGGFKSIGVDPRNKDRIAGVDVGRRVWTYCSNSFTCGVDRSAFDRPIVASTDGIFLNSVPTTVTGDFSLGSWLLDAGDQMTRKVWDFALLEGTLSGEVRVGFTDRPDINTVEWNTWVDAEYRFPFSSRESIFMAIEFRTDEAFKLSGITVYGEKGGAES